MTTRQLHWDVPHDAAPTTFLPLDRELCGVYTLHFANGERYVGQTVSLTNRLAAHLRRWHDIVSLDFIETSREQLNDLERRMITDTERDHVVRNRALTNMPGGPVPLDLVVDVQQQKEWLNGVLDAYPDDRRTKEADRRLRTQRKFEKLAALPQFNEVLADLTTYVSHVIPWPSVTAGQFWAVSALPSTNRSRGFPRLLTVNAHNVELFWIHNNVEPWAVLNVSRSKVTRSDRRRFHIEDTDNYRSYPDAATVTLAPGQISAALQSPSFLAGAREMALGLMRRGPSTYAKFHCDALLDHVLARIGERG